MPSMTSHDPELDMERRLSVSSTSSAATQTEETAPASRPIAMY